jgi:hypothetical protein
MSMKPLRDPHFDESADMRLVDLARAALGVPAPDLSSWETRIAVEGVAVDVERIQAPRGAVLAAEAVANPAGEVIPGAVITVTLSLANEGVDRTGNVRVSVPLPGGAEFRSGSFQRDGRSLLDHAAEEFFGNGTSVGAIAPKSRVTFLWKIGVKSGNKPLVIAPQVSAEDTAIVGADALIVSRKTESQTGFAAEVERYNRGGYGTRPPAQLEDLPIYELDEEELIEYEAGEAALSSTLPEDEYVPGVEPPIAPPPPTTQPEPVPPPDQPAPAPEPGVPEQEPMVPPPPEQPPDVEPAAAAAQREGVVLYGRIDRPSIAYFDRVFNGSKPPTLLNHFILGGALACTRGSDGDDPAALKQHLDAQGQLLQRIVLHEKMGKKEPITGYAGSMSAQPEHLAPAPIEMPQPLEDPTVLLLSVELESPTLSLLQKMREEQARWDFTRARQMTLALQARSITAQAPHDKLEAAQNALRAYAQTAGTQLQRFFVRMRIDRTTGLLFANDETLDDAARVLIAALGALF